MPAAFPTAARVEIPRDSRLMMPIFFESRPLEMPSFLANVLRFVGITITVIIDLQSVFGLDQYSLLLHITHHRLD